MLCGGGQCVGCHKIPEAEGRCKDCELLLAACAMRIEVFAEAEVEEVWQLGFRCKSSGDIRQSTAQRSHLFKGCRGNV